MESGHGWSVFLANGEDGCVFVFEPEQRDSDEDGFGNACDPDYNNNGLVDFSDFIRFANAFHSTDEIYDHDADGFVDLGDFGLFFSLWAHPPGPSGRDVLPFVDLKSATP